MCCAARPISFKRFLFKIHQHPTIRRPGGPFDQKPVRQQTLATAIDIHHTDVKLAICHLGEGNDVTARRPNRGGIAANTIADTLYVAAIGVHHIELLTAAAVRIEDNAIAIWRVGRRGVNRC